MYIKLLPEELNSYKVNMHSHSDVSDSLTRTFELKDLYTRLGNYSAIAFSDHDAIVKHPELTDENFVALTAAEIHANGTENFSGYIKGCHFNVVALDEKTDKQLFWNRERYVTRNCRMYEDALNLDPGEPDFDRIYSPEKISEMFKIARNNGYFVVYNHPQCSGEDYTDYSGYEGMHALEIMNGECSVFGYDEYNGNVYDELLRSGKRIFCVAGDDNHNIAPILERKSSSLVAYTVVKAEKLSYSDIMTALSSGVSYASEAPEIKSIVYDNGAVKIKTSPARKICFTTGIGRADMVMEKRDGTPVTEAEFNAEEDDIYFRFSITDRCGKRAYSNAYFLDDIIGKRGIDGEL